MSMSRRIWLTGASSGLGSALAEHLLLGGAQLALSGNCSASLAGMAERFPGQVLYAPGNLSDRVEARAIGERIVQAWGALDTLILNAGTCEYVDAGAVDDKVFERVITTNLLASQHCFESALPLLRQGREPHLVAIASSITWLPLPGSKDGVPPTGLNILLKKMKRELARDEIDMTVVCPVPDGSLSCAKGKVATPLLWPAEKAAIYLNDRLQSRPREIVFPALLLANLWPLPHKVQH